MPLPHWNFGVGDLVGGRNSTPEPPGAAAAASPPADRRARRLRRLITRGPFASRCCRGPHEQRGWQNDQRSRKLGWLDAGWVCRLGGLTAPSTHTLTLAQLRLRRQRSAGELIYPTVRPSTEPLMELDWPTHRPVLTTPGGRPNDQPNVPTNIPTHRPTDPPTHRPTDPPNSKHSTPNHQPMLWIRHPLAHQRGGFNPPHLHPPLPYPDHRHYTTPCHH